MAPKVPSNAQLLTIKLEDHVFKRKKRKMERMSHAFGHAHWNVQDFGKKLSLNVFKLDVHHDMSIDIVSEYELVKYFGKKSSSNG
jgi:hypothetical protein